MPFYTLLVVGLLLSTLIGLAAYRRGSLTTSGVAGAIITGTAIFGFGGFVPGLLLVAFFVSSSFLSHYKARIKEKFSEKFQKGSRRDLGQALANGGWAALLAVAYGIARMNTWDARVQVLLLAGYIGALATVTADTWATEVGVLSRTPPRMITTGRAVPAGTSGAITPLGTLTALLGGLFIGVVGVVGIVLLAGWNSLPGLLPRLDALPFGGILDASNAWRVVLLAGASGLMGALFDSYLGATVQGIYFCEYDEVQTEKKIHSCGRSTRLVRGWGGLDNDRVNFGAAVFGSFSAILLANWAL